MSDKTGKAPKDLGSLIAAVNIGGKESISAQVLRLPVDKVKSGDQVRKVFNNIDELKRSLQTEGQQSPIIVSPANDEGIYIIQKGERRWRAAKEAEFETIDAIVQELPANIVDKTAGELIENIQREDLTPMEIANALNVFIEEKWTQQKIADRLGKHKTFVSTHLALLKIPACAKDLNDKGIITDTETLNILRRIYDIDVDTCETLCEIAAEEGFISRKDCREALNELLESNSASADLLSGEDGKLEGEGDGSIDETNEASGTQEIREDVAQHEHEHEHEQPSSDFGVAKLERFEQSTTAKTVKEEAIDPSSSSVVELFKQGPGYAEDESEDGDEDGDAKNQADWVNEAEAGETTTASTSEEAPAGEEVDSSLWERVQPADIIIKVRVNVRDRSRPATLMLERVSVNSKYTWVYLTDENIGHLALVSDVTLESVHKNPYRV